MKAAAAICAGLLGASSLVAAPREDLLFDLNAALMTRDGAGFARCFNFRQADAATRQSFIEIIGQILAWPSFDVTTTERSGEGAAAIVQGGRTFTLNGDWRYQVHVLLSKSAPKGFVFPAGRCADGKDRILVTIPAQPEP